MYSFCKIEACEKKIFCEWLLLKVKHESAPMFLIILFMNILKFIFFYKKVCFVVFNSLMCWFCAYEKTFFVGEWYWVGFNGVVLLFIKSYHVLEVPLKKSFGFKKNDFS